MSLKDIPKGILRVLSFTSAPRPNHVLIDEIVLWNGTPAMPDLACAGLDSAASSEHFRVGVDANYVTQGEKADHGFWIDGKRVDPLDLFAVNGANAFRVRLWVGEEGESRLEYAVNLAYRAQQAGLRPYLVMFLSEEWSDVNKQPAPARWADLTLDEQVRIVQQYTRETEQHFIDRGVLIDLYEIGNEIDYGICGVFADETQPRDPASLRSAIWPDQARLLQAAIEGVREADSEARFLLHIANSWSPEFASAFFQAMTDFGVEFDYVGLSYYPSSMGLPVAIRFCDTLNRLHTDIGKPIIIAETAYPAELPIGGMFGDWRRPFPGYAFTPEGQAWWLRDFLAGMRARGDVVGVYLFSPEFWFSGELWGPFALFDSKGEARPAIGSFNIEE